MEPQTAMNQAGTTGPRTLRPARDGRYVDIRQAAELLHISEASVRRYLTQGKLRRFKAGGARTLLLRSQVLGLIKEV